MKKILVMGSLNMDLVTNVKTTPKVGETVLGNGFAEIPGGKGANQASAMGKLKAKVKMLGKVGDDNFGKILMNNLSNDNVDVSDVYTEENQSTGIAMIMVNGNGDNSIVVIPGANFDLKAEEIRDYTLENCDILVAQLETPIKTVENVFERAKTQDKYTILNPAPAQELSDNLLRNVDLLVPNETELEILSGVKINTLDDVVNAAKILVDKGVKELIVTLGKDGAIYFADNDYMKIDAYDVNPIDTTAAGDSFIAGLAVKLAHGKTMKEAIEFAMKVAAITVTRKGAQSSLPTLKEVNNFEGVKR